MEPVEIIMQPVRFVMLPVRFVICKSKTRMCKVSVEVKTRKVFLNFSISGRARIDADSTFNFISTPGSKRGETIKDENRRNLPEDKRDGVIEPENEDESDIEEERDAAE